MAISAFNRAVGGLFRKKGGLPMEKFLFEATSIFADIG
jgi:hypothetical protein